MAVGQDGAEALATDGRNRPVIVGEQSKRLASAIAIRRTGRGWRMQDRFPGTAAYYNLEQGKTSLVSVLPKWDQRMQWRPGSAWTVAVRGGEPSPLEDSVRSLREQVERRCADRGWDAGVRVAERMHHELLRGRLAGVAAPEVSDDAFYDALFEIFFGPDSTVPSETRQALLDLDQAMEWAPGSAEGAIRERRPVKPLEGEDARRLVIELDEVPGEATVEDWFQVAGEATAAAPQMSAADRGRLAAALRQMLDDWTAQQGR